MDWFYFQFAGLGSINKIDKIFKKNEKKTLVLVNSML